MAAGLPSLHQLETKLMCLISQLYFNNVPNVNEIFPSNCAESLSTLSWYALTQILETKWSPVGHLCLYRKKKKLTCKISQLYFNYVPNINETFVPCVQNLCLHKMWTDGQTECNPIVPFGFTGWGLIRIIQIGLTLNCLKVENVFTQFYKRYKTVDFIHITLTNGSLQYNRAVCKKVILTVHIRYVMTLKWQYRQK